MTSNHTCKKCALSFILRAAVSSLAPGAIYMGLIQRQYTGLQNRSLWFESTGPCHHTAPWRSWLTRLTVSQATAGSSPVGVATCGSSATGSAAPCQGEGCGFNSRLPLQTPISDRAGTPAHRAEAVRSESGRSHHKSWGMRSSSPASAEPAAQGPLCVSSQ